MNAQRHPPTYAMEEVPPFRLPTVYAAGLVYLYDQDHTLEDVQLVVFKHNGVVRYAMYNDIAQEFKDWILNRVSGLWLRSYPEADWSFNTPLRFSRYVTLGVAADSDRIHGVEVLVTTLRVLDDAGNFLQSAQHVATHHLEWTYPEVRYHFWLAAARRDELRNLTKTSVVVGEPVGYQLEERVEVYEDEHRAHVVSGYPCHPCNYDNVGALCTRFTDVPYPTALTPSGAYAFGTEWVCTELPYRWEYTAYDVTIRNERSGLCSIPPPGFSTGAPYLFFNNVSLKAEGDELLYAAQSVAAPDAFALHAVQQMQPSLVFTHEDILQAVGEEVNEGWWINMGEYLGKGVWLAAVGVPPREPHQVALEIPRGRVVRPSSNPLYKGVVRRIGEIRIKAIAMSDERRTVEVLAYQRPLASRQM